MPQVSLYMHRVFHLLCHLLSHLTVTDMWGLCLHCSHTLGFYNTHSIIFYCLSMGGSQRQQVQEEEPSHASP